MAKTFDELVKYFTDKDPPLDDASVIAVLRDIIDYHNDKCSDVNVASSNIDIDCNHYLGMTGRRNRIKMNQLNLQLPLQYEFESV